MTTKRLHFVKSVIFDEKEVEIPSLDTHSPNTKK